MATKLCVRIKHAINIAFTMETADYNQHFVYIRQLWNSPWGYGGSLNGLGDGISFEIGKVHIVGSLIAAALGIWFFFKKNQHWKILLLFSLFLGIAAFMITFYSDFIWDRIEFFAYIQFPWRFLMFTAFAASFLLGGLVLVFKQEKLKIIISSILIVLMIFFYKDFFKPNGYLTQVTDKDYISHDVIRWHTSIMAFEYIPDGIATKQVNGATKPDLTQSQVATRSFTVVKGSMNVKEENIKPHYKKLLVNGNGGILRINQFYYPGWKVYIDGVEVSYSTNNKLKLLDVTVPSGEHTIEAIFTDTPVRLTGNVLSAASILAIILYIIVFLRKRKGTKVHETRKQKKK